MKNLILKILFVMFIFSIITLEIIAQDQKEYPANYATSPRFKALVYYTEHAEEAHVEFALQAVEFFHRCNSKTSLYKRFPVGTEQRYKREPL
jgi:hypothetical protein